MIRFLSKLFCWPVILVTFFVSEEWELRRNGFIGFKEALTLFRAHRLGKECLRLRNTIKAQELKLRKMVEERRALLKGVSKQF